MTTFVPPYRTLRSAARCLTAQPAQGARGRAQRAGGHRTSAVLLALLAAVAGPLCGALPPAVDGQPLPTLAPMLERVTPAVVNIATRGYAHGSNHPLITTDPLLHYFFDLPDNQVQRPTQSLGSGVILDADRGYVVTNHHVIGDAEEITVMLHDGRRFKAKVVGSDPLSDVAVIRIPAEKLTSLPPANSDALRVGDFVLAIGNPFGLGQTVTSGIVSALGRTGLGIEGYEDFIQTDASINPGNSGGALVNLRGELVGINTAILAPNGGNIGIGFAIPVNMARAIVHQLVVDGRVHRGTLGFTTEDFSPELTQALGLVPRSGPVVSQVTPGSPADRAGIRLGDVVIAVDGKAVQTAAQLRNLLALLPVGRVTRLDLRRDTQLFTVQAVIAEPARARLEAWRVHPRLGGALLGDLQHSAAPGISGVEVLEVQPGSAGWASGLRPEDVITAFNRTPVHSLFELRQMANANPGAMVLSLQRGAQALSLLVP